MPTQILISDTNIWIDLHRGGLLDEAFKLPYQFVTTDFVEAELKDPDGTDLRVRGLHVEQLSEEEILQLHELRYSLNNSSLADVSCYYLAQSKGLILLTNDKAVRNAARQAKIEVHGTLWVLDQLYSLDHNSSNSLADSLEKMIARGARFPREECDSRLRTWRTRT